MTLLAYLNTAVLPYVAMACERDEASARPNIPVHDPSFHRDATLLFDEEREDLIARIVEATSAELSPVAIARHNPQLQGFHAFLAEPEALLMENQKAAFLCLPPSQRTADHPFLAGIRAREARLEGCPAEVVNQYRNYRERCIAAQGEEWLQHVAPKAILYIDDQRIYRISQSLAYAINSIDEYNISQRSNDAGNHAVCALGPVGRSVHFKNNNCHTDLSPAMESAMYGFYNLIAPQSLIPSFFMRIENLPVKNVTRTDLKDEWNRIVTMANEKTASMETRQKAIQDFIAHHADQQSTLFTIQPQSFILQGSRTAQGMRLDHFLEQARNGQASYDAINRESFGYHILLSILFNPSDYKADNLFYSPEGRIIGIDNDGCLAHPVVWQNRTEFVNEHGRQRPVIAKTYYTGVKNILYLLPLMEEPVRETVRDAFKNLNIPLTLVRWMSFLNSQDKRYEKTFSAHEVERHIDSYHSFPVRLVPGALTSLYESLCQMKTVLYDSVAGLTYQKLLLRMQPLVGEGYQAYLQECRSDPLEAMSVIYDRTMGLETLLPHRMQELENQAHGKDDDTLNRTARLHDEIRDVLPKLQDDDRHIACLLDYLIRHLPDDASYLSLMQDSKRFSRMLAADASVPSLRWLLEHKKQGVPLSLQFDHQALVNSAGTHLASGGRLNAALSVILQNFREWADELLPVLPEDIWHQITREQIQGRQHDRQVLDYLMRRDPIGLNRANETHQTPLDIAVEGLLADQNADLATDLIHRGASRVSLNGRQYRSLQKNRASLSSSFWEAFGVLRKRNAKVDWVVTLEEVFPLAQQGESHVIQGASGETRRLTESILKQIDNPNYRVPHERRKVIQLEKNGCIAFLKYYPELPGIEEAVGELTRSVIGFGAPYGELFRFPDRTPVWISQGIRGETLQRVLIHGSARLDRLDPVSVTQMILMAMLVNPEDGKHDNYIVEPVPDNSGLYRLSCPDNDHAFVPAFVKSKPAPGSVFTKPVVQVKTILYCLDLMNRPVPQATRDLFLKVDPLAVMKDWLHVLDRRNQRYAALYETAREASALLKDHACYTGIPFQKGMIEHLYNKWVRLQDLLGQDTAITPMRILNTLEPRLANRYRQAFASSVKKTLLERFSQVDGAFYQQKGATFTTLTASGSILTSQNIPAEESTLEAVRNGTSLGPRQAIKELEFIAEEKRKSGLSVGQGITDVQRETFLKQFSFEGRNISEQRSILDQLAPHWKKLRYITLKKSSVVTNSILDRIIRLKGLVSLDVSGCREVTHAILPLLSRYAPSASSSLKFRITPIKIFGNFL